MTLPAIDLPSPKRLFTAVTECAKTHAPPLPDGWHYGVTVGFHECWRDGRMIGYRVVVELTPSDRKENP